MGDKFHGRNMDGRYSALGAHGWGVTERSWMWDVGDLVSTAGHATHDLGNPRQATPRRPPYSHG